MPSPSGHPVGIDYQVPAPTRATERHGPYYLVRDEHGVRITGVYRGVQGPLRKIIYGVGIFGGFLYVLGSLLDIDGRGLRIDLTRFGPVLGGAVLLQIAVVVMALAAAAWIVARVVTWRHLHRLEIEIAPDELLIRNEVYLATQQTIRWPREQVQRVDLDRHELTVHPRAGEAFTIIIGGSTGAARWVAERICQELGLPIPTMES